MLSLRIQLYESLINAVDITRKWKIKSILFLKGPLSLTWPSNTTIFQKSQVSFNKMVLKEYTHHMKGHEKMGLKTLYSCIPIIERVVTGHLGFLKDANCFSMPKLSPKETGCPLFTKKSFIIAGCGCSSCSYSLWR